LFLLIAGQLQQQQAIASATAQQQHAIAAAQ
jgi:hypothetical protein